MISIHHIESIRARQEFPGVGWIVVTFDMGVSGGRDDKFEIRVFAPYIEGDTDMIKANTFLTNLTEAINRLPTARD